jgi:hypothetical protein
MKVSWVGPDTEGRKIDRVSEAGLGIMNFVGESVTFKV